MVSPGSAESDAHEEQAWAAVTARWQDEEAHRAYLDAHTDLEGLAEAGRRYRGALERDPADATALRWRDEVVRRATAVALAQLPRTPPPRLHPRLRRSLAAAAIVVLLVAVGWAVMRCGAARAGAVP